MRTAAFVFAVAMAAMTGCAASGPRTITKVEARSLPESVVRHRVMAQLSDLLTGPSGRRGAAPVHPLDDMSFVARPRMTFVTGLCQIDLLKVEFRSREPGGGGDANTPVAVNGFRSTSYFHFLRPPTAPFFEIETSEGRPDDAACAETDLFDSDYFVAEDEEVATNGFLVFRRVVDAVADGEPTFALTCDKFHPEAHLTCVDILRQVAEAPVYSVARCEIERPEAPGAHCYRVEASARSLRIVATPITYGPNMRPPLTILDVHMDSLIILAHERVD